MFYVSAYQWDFLKLLVLTLVSMGVIITSVHPLRAPSWPYMRCPVERGRFCPWLCTRIMNVLVTRSTNSFRLPYTLYTDIPKIPDFTKKARVSWMCFIMTFTLYIIIRYRYYVSSSKSVICMGLLISRPNVFVVYGERKFVCLVCLFVCLFVFVVCWYHEIGNLFFLRSNMIKNCQFGWVVFAWQDFFSKQMMVGTVGSQ